MKKKSLKKTLKLSKMNISNFSHKLMGGEIVPTCSDSPNCSNTDPTIVGKSCPVTRC